MATELPNTCDKCATPDQRGPILHEDGKAEAATCSRCGYVHKAVNSRATVRLRLSNAVAGSESNVARMGAEAWREFSRTIPAIKRVEDPSVDEVNIGVEIGGRYVICICDYDAPKFSIVAG